MKKAFKDLGYTDIVTAITLDTAEYKIKTVDQLNIETIEEVIGINGTKCMKFGFDKNISEIVDRPDLVINKNNSYWSTLMGRADNLQTFVIINEEDTEAFFNLYNMIANLNEENSSKIFREPLTEWEEEYPTME